MHRQRMHYGWVVVIFTVAATVHAQEDAETPDKAEDRRVELGLERAVDMALTGNPAMDQVLHAQDAADAGVGAARGMRYPMLSVGGNWTRGNNSLHVFGTLLETEQLGAQHFDPNFLNDPPPTNKLRASVDLRMPIFDQFDAGTAIAKAHLERKKAGLQREATEQIIRDQVVQAYYRVLVAQAQLAVANDAVETSRAEVERISEMVDREVAHRSDLLAMQVQLARFEQQQVRATGDLRSARAVLSAVLGGAAVEKFALSGQLAARRFTTDKLEQLIVRALRKRMDLRQSELDVRQRGEDVRRAKGSYLPRIDAFGSYGHSWEELDEDGGDDWTIGVQARWDLFQGGRYDRLKQAQAARRMAEAQRSRLANEIRAEVTQAQARLESAASRVVLTARALDHAQENLRLARTRYENQLITITELLRAQTAEVRARLDLLNSRYEHYVGYAALLRATGSLNDVSAFVRDTRQPTEEK